MKLVMGGTDLWLKSLLSPSLIILYGTLLFERSGFMISNSSNFNELGNSEFAVWCRLDPGIPPDRWAFLCRHIGRLSPREFSQVSLILNPHHRSLKMALKRHIWGLIGLGEVRGQDGVLWFLWDHLACVVSIRGRLGGR